MATRGDRTIAGALVDAVSALSILALAFVAVSSFASWRFFEIATAGLRATARWARLRFVTRRDRCESGALPRIRDGASLRIVVESDLIGARLGFVAPNKTGCDGTVIAVKFVQIIKIVVIDGFGDV